MKNYITILLTVSSLISLAFVVPNYYEKTGYASYYADKFQDRQTASGALYDSAGMTCAHKSLKFGTWLKVTRLDNGTSVKVKVTDRGPFIKGRVIDLSKAAAKELDMLKKGVVKVKIKSISPKD